MENSWSFSLGAEVCLDNCFFVMSFQGAMTPTFRVTVDTMSRYCLLVVGSRVLALDYGLHAHQAVVFYFKCVHVVKEVFPHSFLLFNYA